MIAGAGFRTIESSSYEVRAPGSIDAVGVQEQVARLDASLFDHVRRQVSWDDRRSLLAIENAVASDGPYTYLEIGSYLGGTVQAPLADPRCTRIVSIDPRTQTAPDGRLGHYAYEVNTSERMLELLGDVAHGDLSKLQTIEARVDDIDLTRFPGRTSASSTGSTRWHWSLPRPDCAPR